MIENIKNIKSERIKFILLCLGFCLLLIFSVFIIAYLNKKEKFEGIVSEISYQRDRYILEWQVTNQEGFQENINPKGYDIIQDGTRHHHNRSESYRSTCSGTKIVDGKSKSYTYSCTKTRSVPVYHPWYRYKLNQYIQVKRFIKQDKTVKGTLKAFDPEITFNKICDNQPDYTANDPHLGCQIEGTPKAWYYITYLALEPKEVETLKVICQITDYPRWSDTKVLTKISGQFYVHNRSLICESIRVSK